jgi:hypothetical protein
MPFSVARFRAVALRLDRTRVNGFCCGVCALTHLAGDCGSCEGVLLVNTEVSGYVPFSHVTISFVTEVNVLLTPLCDGNVLCLRRCKRQHVRIPQNYACSL